MLSVEIRSNATEAPNRIRARVARGCRAFPAHWRTRGAGHRPRVVPRIRTVALDTRPSALPTSSTSGQRDPSIPAALRKRGQLLVRDLDPSGGLAENHAAG